MQWFQIHEKKAAYRALDPFWEWPTPATFLFCFVLVELSAGVGLGIHPAGQTLNVNQGLLAKVCPAACVQQNPLVLPVWQTCPQVNKVRSKQNQLPRWDWGSQTKVRGSVLTGVFLGVMLGLGMGHQKAHSGCSLKRYKKPWNLVRTGRAGDFQWNCRWCGHWARKRQAVQSHAQTILLSPPWLYCSSCAKLKKCRRLQSRKDKLWVIVPPTAKQGALVPTMRPSHQHRGEHLGKGACFQHSLRALWLLEEFSEGLLMALLGAGDLHFAALWWELHSSYPPWDCLSWGDPCACCWPPKEPPELTMGSIGRALWNVPPVDAAWLKCEWYKCKFWKCIILYDEVWQRNAWFSFIVSYILFLWELRRMFSYLTCFLSSLQFICQSDPPKESKLALIVRQMKGKEQGNLQPNPVCGPGFGWVWCRRWESKAICGSAQHCNRLR